jgi:hypothetical protein
MIHIVKSFTYVAKKERFSTVELKSRLIDNALRNSIIIYCLTDLPTQFNTLLRTAEQIKCVPVRSLLFALRYLLLVIILHGLLLNMLLGKK